MSGTTDSDTQDDIRAEAMDEQKTQGQRVPENPETDPQDPQNLQDPQDPQDLEADEEYGDEDARRARWTATGTGALLTLAGLAAALLRLTGSAPALVPAAYALGAAVCALAAVLGSQGRTRRALWLLIAGVMIMAVGDQSD
ncbi:hypothetical protein [Streptomyces aurantiogriseus]|uniref:Uncharacterized protein n=1 Tax=Streptomyces aurantiogriseus TaxID=66870 RepID=A0A918CCD2_9ACTN|nr:hypothetical protein [Streptomyces aurantiogriseus]GGR16735.1 hypothetical protein GCM10010251_36070 [Streptomyces aurantiogriseus]